MDDTRTRDARTGRPRPELPESLAWLYDPPADEQPAQAAEPVRGAYEHAAPAAPARPPADPEALPTLLPFSAPLAADGPAPRDPEPFPLSRPPAAYLATPVDAPPVDEYPVDGYPVDEYPVDVYPVDEYPVAASPAVAQEPRWSPPPAPEPPAAWASPSAPQAEPYALPALFDTPRFTEPAAAYQIPVADWPVADAEQPVRPSAEQPAGAFDEEPADVTGDEPAADEPADDWSRPADDWSRPADRHVEEPAHEEPADDWSRPLDRHTEEPAIHAPGVDGPAQDEGAAAHAPAPWRDLRTATTDGPGWMAPAARPYVPFGVPVSDPGVSLFEPVVRPAPLDEPLEDEAAQTDAELVPAAVEHDTAPGVADDTPPPDADMPGAAAPAEPAGEDLEPADRPRPTLFTRAPLEPAPARQSALARILTARREVPAEEATPVAEGMPVDDSAPDPARTPDAESTPAVEGTPDEDTSQVADAPQVDDVPDGAPSAPATTVAGDGPLAQPPVEAPRRPEPAPPEPVVVPPRPHLDDPALGPLWTAVRETLQSSARHADPAVDVRGLDQAGRLAVAGLLGVPAVRAATRVDLAELEAVVTAASGMTLAAAAERHVPVGPGRRARTQTRTAAHRAGQEWLEAHPGTAAQPWTAMWLETIRRDAVGGDAGLTGHEVTSALTVLEALTADRDDAERPSWQVRTELAARVADDEHALDEGSSVATLVLRGLAAAAGTPVPSDAAGRRRLWRRFGVLPDLVSTSCLAVGVAPADDALARRWRLAAADGVPVHVTARDLRAGAEWVPVDEGWPAVLVVDSARVLDAVAERFGGRVPAVWVDGASDAPSLDLVARLYESGTAVRFVTGFDAPGLALGSLLVRRFGATPWRMTPAAYRAAVRSDLPPLTGRVGEPEWAPELGAAMTHAGRAVPVEQVLEGLLDELGLEVGRAGGTETS